MSKNTILTGGICFLLVFLLLHPAESLSCARAGMTLWLNTLIPTLLPFIILTGMLTHTGHIRKLLLPFESFFHIFPGVSIWGGYVFVLGMLCGYPLGAKLASDLYGLHKISKKEALYLTTFCNNPSPAFIITYLCKSCLKDTVPAGMVFASIFSANLICMLFFRFFVYTYVCRQLGVNKLIPPISVPTQIFSLSVSRQLMKLQFNDLSGISCGAELPPSTDFQS